MPRDPIKQIQQHLDSDQAPTDMRVAPKLDGSAVLRFEFGRTTVDLDLDDATEVTTGAGEGNPDPVGPGTLLVDVDMDGDVITGFGHARLLYGQYTRELEGPVSSEEVAEYVVFSPGHINDTQHPINHLSTAQRGEPRVFAFTKGDD